MCRVNEIDASIHLIQKERLIKSLFNSINRDHKYLWKNHVLVESRKLLAAFILNYRSIICESYLINRSLTLNRKMNITFFFIAFVVVDVESHLYVLERFVQFIVKSTVIK